jgi:outer membrane lipopolysaccharide assembly protein LptE/RlpB
MRAPVRPGEEFSVQRKTVACFLVLLCLLVAACGYRPLGRDMASRFGEGETISIPIFANKTFKSNLENVLLNQLIDEFAKRKHLQIGRGDGTDYTLSGEVLSYTRKEVSYSGADEVTEYRATMVISATLRKNSTRSVLWKGELSWSQDYPSSSDIALLQNNEEAAIREISQRLAQQLYLKMSEDF